MRKGLVGELPLLSNASDALKSSGETYKYLPVLLEMRFSNLVNGIVFRDPRLAQDFFLCYLYILYL